LIAAHGNDSLDPFALRADKRHVVAPDGAAVMSYRCVLGVGLASGDPIGARDARPAAVAAHLAQCDAAGWRPAVLAAGEESLPMYRAFGLRAMYVGDEALIDVCAFALGGGRMRNVRQAVSRSRNFGVTTTHHRQAELDAELRTQLIAVADEWRHGAPEMGFSMALDTLLSAGPEDGDAVIVVARDANGLPIGFQRYLPCRGGHGLSADAMRRAADAPNGITERMIVDTIRWAAEHGVGQVSLNFAAFRRLLDQPGLSMGRATLVVFDRLLPFVRIISLARFNAKFHPRWVPRYLVYRSPLDLPAIGLAALSAEGFLPFDRQRLGQRELGRAG
jgi:lysyl-tRNA synthetase class 2